jgi:hypothetical protein
MENGGLRSSRAGDGRQLADANGQFALRRAKIGNLIGGGIRKL